MDTKSMKFLNTQVNNMNLQEILHYMELCINSKKMVHLVSLNVDQIIKIEDDEKFRGVVDKAELVITDGTPLMWISKISGKPIVQKLPGQYLTEKVLEHAAQVGWRVFFLGGKEGVARQAARNMQTKYKGLVVSGTYSPPFGFENDKNEIDKINNLLIKNQSDILVVGLSAPKQEFFVYDNRDVYQIPISMSVGAAIDFMAGNIKRAPDWMNKVGLEWLFRFSKEPTRLFRRYFINDMRIIPLAIKHMRKMRKEKGN